MLNGGRMFGITHDPLLDSPYVQQFDVGTSSPPPVGNFFLLLNGGDFLLLNGDNLSLL